MLKFVVGNATTYFLCHSQYYFDVEDFRHCVYHIILTAINASSDQVVANVCF